MSDKKEKRLKSDKFLSFYFFVMYLFTSMPAIQFSMIENINVLFLLLGYGLTLTVAVKYRINFRNKNLFIVFLIIIVWTGAQFVLHSSYFRLSPFIIMEIFTAYVIIKIYKNSIFRRFEDVTYVLSIIALIGWSLLIIANPVIKYFAETFGIEASGEKSASFILYTVNLDTYRNCGFAWEPGRTACLTCVGILFNLMRTRCNLRTVRFWVMTICVLTTLSTTGFFVLIVVVVLCYKTFHHINIVHVSVLALLVAGIMSLPFMGEKIGVLVGQASTQEMTSMSNKLDWSKENKSETERNFYVPQRFEGLMFSVINLFNTNYYIGDGRDFQQFYINRILGWKVKTSEGVLEIVVRYGFIIGVICYILLFRTSFMISTYYDTKNKWLYFIIFLLINISYNFWEVPIFMAIWMMPLFRYVKKFPLVGIQHGNCLNVTN